jgi:hypothetical protein
VVWPQNHSDDFRWFGLKTSGDGFLQFGLKSGDNGFLQFGLKACGNSFSSVCALKPMATVCEWFGLKT